jgi:RimJ/RimL family protein N-acetyltransferase
MDEIPFRRQSLRPVSFSTPSAAVTPAPGDVAKRDWRHGLPQVSSARVTLRELCLEDAPSLFTMIASEEVSRFISPPPSSIEGFERFIAWAVRERQHGRYVCFAVVPEGMTTAIGLFQLRSLETGFANAEWGFALGSGFWGTGLFMECATLVLDFAFDVVNVHRLEARASAANARGNGALRKLGAVQEGVLRRSFFRGGEYHDQVMWSVLASDWRAQRERRGPQVH